MTHRTSCLKIQVYVVCNKIKLVALVLEKEPSVWANQQEAIQHYSLDQQVWCVCAAAQHLHCSGQNRQLTQDNVCVTQGHSIRIAAALQ